MEKPSLDTAKAGAMRFNTDLSQLEIYDGNQWQNVLSTSPELQTGGTRGVLGGGRSGGGASQPKINNIQFINIATTGNATDFGDATYSDVRASGTVSSRTRGVFMRSVSSEATMDFITIASTGNAATFGEDTIAGHGAVCSSETRGVNMSGEGNNNISYITIATTGNSVDFGDVHGGGGNSFNGPTGLGSPTRGIAICGRLHPSPNNDGNSIEYITISTLGNSADFGDLSEETYASGSASNSTRGLVFSLRNEGSPNNGNAIDFLTIASLGNSVRFGDLNRTNTPYTNNNGSGVASPTRAVYCGGYSGSPTPQYSVVTQMEFVQIMTEGNSIDFGDLAQKMKQAGSVSNGHGGL